MDPFNSKVGEGGQRQQLLVTPIMSLLIILTCPHHYVAYCLSLST
jgi:hypothetical protein